MSYPPGGFGPESMNVVGLRSANNSEMILVGKWFEVLTPENLSPQNIRIAQLERRTGIVPIQFSGVSNKISNHKTYQIRLNSRGMPEVSIWVDGLADRSLPRWNIMGRQAIPID